MEADQRRLLQVRGDQAPPPLRMRLLLLASPLLPLRVPPLHLPRSRGTCCCFARLHLLAALPPLQAPRAGPALPAAGADPPAAARQPPERA